MTRFVSMLGFHLRIFAQNSYFVQLLITSTLSVLILQFLAGLTAHAADPQVWLRAGMVGMWSVCTVAAGLIGFQRFQGTLVHLVLSPQPTARILLPLIASASSFGLLAFPIAALGSWVLRIPFAQINGLALVLGIFVFWVACVSISAVIAAIFVLTPHAMTYEGLLLVPLILVSGIFALPGPIDHIISPFSYFVPPSGAVKALLVSNTFSTSFWINIVLSATASSAWFVLGYYLTRLATKKAISMGSLEVV